MKGISTIIATILLLIITISLVGTAYMFMLGMITGRISKPISILGASCNIANNITLVISNDGTDPIEEGEIRIINGSVSIQNFESITIAPRNSNVTTFQAAPGSKPVLVISPSNSVVFTVWC